MNISISMFLLIINPIVSAMALAWVGLWFGLKSRSSLNAVVRTVVLGKGVPYLLRFLVPMTFQLIIRFIPYSDGTQMSSYWIFSVGMKTADLLYFLWLIRWARRRLSNELRTAGPARFSLPKLSGRWLYSDQQ